MKTGRKILLVISYLLLGTYVLLLTGFWGAPPSWIVKNGIMSQNSFSLIYMLIYFFGGLSRIMRIKTNRKFVYLSILLDVLIFIPLLNWVDLFLTLIGLVLIFDWINGYSILKHEKGNQSTEE